jgi:hypothetical protein
VVVPGSDDRAGCQERVVAGVFFCIRHLAASSAMSLVSP